MRSKAESLILNFIRAMGLVAVFIPLFMIIYVLAKGLPVVNFEFLFTPPKGGLSAEGGISSCTIATLWLLVITMLILIPLGIGAGIYLAEYAPENKLTGLIRYCIDLLAGIPSVVFGAFGFIAFVVSLKLGYSILAGALTLAILLLPFLVRTTEEALRSVPRTYREAALSLGATRWQTLRYVLLPAALPGILTGIILSIGRIFAESAPLWLTMGGSAEMPYSPLDPGRSLAVHIFYLAMETRAPEKAMGTGAVLILIILILNFLVRWISAKVRRL